MSRIFRRYSTDLYLPIERPNLISTYLLHFASVVRFNSPGFATILRKSREFESVLYIFIFDPIYPEFITIYSIRFYFAHLPTISARRKDMCVFCNRKSTIYELNCPFDRRRDRRTWSRPLRHLYHMKPNPRSRELIHRNNPTRHH